MSVIHEPSSDTRRTNLPEELTSFLGRARELDQLRVEVLGHRMVTVMGPGGMGKTRIAQRLGGELLEMFPDGVWLIELEALSDPALVAQEVAKRLMIRELPGVELLDTICAHLESWNTLLILDNCEHVSGACAVVSDWLLAGCPRVRILATSRQPTGAARESIWRLPPLSVAPGPGPAQSEAARLFIERAWPNLAGGDVGLARLSHVTQICRSLEGIPLAIELAAARARVMSVDELLSRLDDRLRVLAGGTGPVPRHQTMRATIDWSYQLLDDKERVLFRRLSVFAGGFSLRDAEDICWGGGLDRDDVLDVLSRLNDKSLVLPIEIGEQERPMRILATLQQYGHERLEESGEAAIYARRHADHFLRFAMQARDLQNSSEHAGRLDLLERELDNMRAALTSSQGISAELNLALATALLGFWDERGYVTEGGDWLARALSAWPAESALRADALGAAGWLAQRRGDFAGASAYFEESIEIASHVGDRNVQARSLRNLALIHVLRADGQGALPLVKDAFAISDGLGDRAGTAGALLVMALAAYFERDFEAARAHAEQSLVQHRELGDEKVAAFLLACLATLALDHRDLTTARANLKESLEISQRLHEKVDVAFVLESCARLAAATSDPIRAIRLAAAAGSIRRAVGAPSAPIWSVMVEAMLGPAQEAVGAESAGAASRDGSMLTLEKAIDESLEWLVAAEQPASSGTDGLLTRRELEIAALVGRGLRNREIATRLFLSTRTVDAHVEHIREKLDFHSRSQIAAWAVARGLVAGSARN